MPSLVGVAYRLSQILVVLINDGWGEGVRILEWFPELTKHLCSFLPCRFLVVAMPFLSFHAIPSLRSPQTSVPTRVEVSMFLSIWIVCPTVLWDTGYNAVVNHKCLPSLLGQPVDVSVFSDSQIQSRAESQGFHQGTFPVGGIFGILYFSYYLSVPGAGTDLRTPETRGWKDP